MSKLSQKDGHVFKCCFQLVVSYTQPPILFGYDFKVENATFSKEKDVLAYIYKNIKVRVQKTQHEFLVNPLWRRMLLNQFQYCEFYPYESIFFCRALLIPAAIEVFILACQCLIRLLLKYMHIFMIHLMCYQVISFQAVLLHSVRHKK